MHRFVRVSRIFCVLVIAFCVMKLVGPVSTGSSHAQPPSIAEQPAVEAPAVESPAAQADQAKPSLPPEVKKAAEAAKVKFEEVRKRLAVEMGKMRSTNIRFMNEEDNSPLAAEKYRRHRNNSRELMKELFATGLDVIRNFGDSQEAATYLATMLEHRMKHDYYDQPTMEAGARMIDLGVQLPFVYPTTARAAIVCGDFELARKLFEAMNIDQLDDADQTLFYSLDALEQQWAIEEELNAAAEGTTNPEVRMMTTRGEVTIELFIESAPSTVANFIKLVDDGYYDGLDFFQVIDHILALTGDESGDGQGNTGKFLMDEHTRENARMPLAGSLVMAKVPSGAKGEFLPHSASAQFAILYLPIANLGNSQTIFGRVTKGMDVVSELRRVDPSKEKAKNEILLPPDRILTMEVTKRPDKLPEIEYASH